MIWSVPTSSSRSLRRSFLDRRLVTSPLRDPVRSTSTMRFAVTFSPEDGFVRTTVYEPLTPDIAKQLAKESEAIRKREGVARALLDARQAVCAAELWEQYSLAYREIGQSIADRAERIAILVNPDDRSYDFLEIVFWNAGYNVKSFSDEDNALGWLRE